MKYQSPTIDRLILQIVENIERQRQPLGCIVTPKHNELDELEQNQILVQGLDGSFYGTTFSGGSGGSGAIFRLTIVPEFQAMTLTNDTLTLTWSTEAGGIYQLKSSASLTTPNWTNLGSPVTATNGTLTFTDAVTNAPQRFYRVSLAP